MAQLLNPNLGLVGYGQLLAIKMVMGVFVIMEFYALLIELVMSGNTGASLKVKNSITNVV